MCLHEKKKVLAKKVAVYGRNFSSKTKTIRWREHTNEMSLEEKHSKLLTWPKRMYSAKANLMRLF